jgi:protein-disulfide isomerase
MRERVAMTKNKLGILIVVFGVLLVVLMKDSLLNPQGSGLSSPRTKGNPRAKIKIVEFADFQCPACAKGAEILKKFMGEHPKDVYLQMRYFPLAMHPNAAMAAKYAECASSQSQFWPFQDYLFEHQLEWSKLADPKPAFEVIAQSLKMDKVSLDQCLNDIKTQETISEDKEEGNVRGVKSTPTYFVNGRMIVGVKTLESDLQSLFNAQNN